MITKTVASFTDAWIETRWDSVELIDVKSHLLQMRGLKLRYSYGKIVELSSHLLQMRGLKLHHLPFQKYHYVASFTDAWIETDYSKRIFFYIWSHLLQMRGLKHQPHKALKLLLSRIFYRCVD